MSGYKWRRCDRWHCERDGGRARRDSVRRAHGPCSAVRCGAACIYVISRFHCVLCPHRSATPPSVAPRSLHWAVQARWLAALRRPQSASHSRTHPRSPCHSLRLSRFSQSAQSVSQTETCAASHSHSHITRRGRRRKQKQETAAAATAATQRQQPQPPPPPSISPPAAGADWLSSVCGLAAQMCSNRWSGTSTRPTEPLPPPPLCSRAQCCTCVSVSHSSAAQCSAAHWVMVA